MRIIAIDPGPTQSAVVIYEDGEIIDAMILGNDSVIDNLSLRAWWPGTMAVEMIASYGMAVGKEVFETCVTIGRFIQAWKGRNIRIMRKEVKLHLCGSVKAKDANIRQALIDLYGGQEKAVGKKANPGPLYGIKKDLWSALAVAVTAAENIRLAQEIERG